MCKSLVVFKKFQKFVSSFLKRWWLVVDKQNHGRRSTNFALVIMEKNFCCKWVFFLHMLNSKVLQGNYGFATVISDVQSMGYIYGVVVRTIQGLPVSPIEVVALMLSLLILIKALLHNIVSRCHRPLHVYLISA